MTGQHPFSEQQARFVSEFLRTDSPPHHLLLAPSGTGKTTTALRVVAQLVRQRFARRVLIVVQFVALREQLCRRLEVELPGVPIMNIDRQVLRELEARVSSNESPWPEEVVAILTGELFLAPGVAASLASVGWDLAFVDAFDGSPPDQVRMLLEHLAQLLNVRRMLLVATDHPQIDVGSIIPGLRETIWQPRTITATLSWRGITYRRGSDEVAFLAELAAALPRLSREDKSGRFLADALRRTASSSLFALEQSLRRARNELIHAASSRPEDPILASYLDRREAVWEEDQLRDESGGRAWAEPGTALGILDGLLERLEQVASDEKLQALIRFLTTHPHAGGNGPAKACVFSSYADTVAYLRSALEDAGLKVKAISGGTPFARRNEAIDEFNRSGGILVASSPSLMGIELEGPADLIHYDLPRDERELLIRATRVRVPNSAPINMWVPRDESGSISDEDELLRRLGGAV